MITALVALVFLMWLGFVVHASPRFPGSLPGTLLGFSAVVLMVLPAAAYALVKRSPVLKARLVRRVSMKQLLDWHVYASVLGAGLAILHAAHKFDSPLGVALTAFMLASVASGYVGRYFLGYVSADLREKQQWLESARRAYDAGTQQIEPLAPADARRLAENVVELEYSVAMHDLLTGRAARWLRAHRVLAAMFFALLALHLFAAISYGLRWW